MKLSQQFEALLLEDLQQHGTQQRVAHHLRRSLAAVVRVLDVMLQKVNKRQRLTANLNH
jgi:hypothetical protein